MARKIIEDHTKIISANLEEIMADRFGRYSKYIIQERALPDARDGLKPVQRRILYAMYKEGNVFNKQHRKSAKTVGLVIGNYHPHGDSSVYEAMVRMSQSWKMNIPLIDMHGNNGSIDDDPAAAMRYTEARLAKISSTMLEEINQNTVKYAPNFDDTEMEPTVLSSKFPLLLVNGATGISAGYATNIPPHNFNEVIDACIYTIINPQASIDDITDIIKGPDFPTGGIIQGEKEIKNALKKGRGRVLIRSKVKIEDAKTINQIIVTEIPYEVVKVNLVKKIDDIRLNKKIDGILDVRDESDRNGLRIVIDVKKDADEQLILNYLYKNTDLQTYYSYNMIAIVNRRPQLLNVLGLIQAFVNYRKEIVLKRSLYDYEQKNRRCHILEGLIKAVSLMDEIIKIIRSSKDKADSKKRLISQFNFSEEQAEAIVTLRLYRLSNTDVIELRNEFSLLVNQMEELKTIIDSPEVLNNEVIKELKTLRAEYNYPRKTVIESEISEIVIDKLQMISNEDFMVTITKAGYIKKVSKRSFQASNNVITGMKENDELIGYKEVNNKDILLIFTSAGNYCYLPVYDLSESKWKDVGNHLNNYIKINSAAEEVVDCYCVNDFTSYAFIVTISAQGAIKKTLLADLNVTRYSKPINLLKLKNQDYLVATAVCYQNDDIVISSKLGYTLRYGQNIISETKGKSFGVKAINLSKNDELVGLAIVNQNTDFLNVFTTDNLSKRIRISEINYVNRGNKGELIAKKNKSNPHLLRYLLANNLYDEITFIEDNDLKIVSVKDITLKNKETSFSSSLNLSKPIYLVKDIKQIIHKEYHDETKVKVENLSMFDNEG